MIVTIDGPSGSGKSTVARELAKRLDFEFLDTGAMFRAVGLALLERGIDLTDPSVDLEPILNEIQLNVRPGRVWLNDREVTMAIRTPEISTAASQVAVFPSVRSFLVKQQRAIADGRRMICEGRDQGTVVFPFAKPKFFLTASPEARAKRRCAELNDKGDSITLEEVSEAMLNRDHRDSSRACAPLKAADDALILDTSDMALEEVLDWMEREIRRCIPG